MNHNQDKPLWGWQELIQAVDGRPINASGSDSHNSDDHNAARPNIARVQIDSRLVQPGDLFVALAGDPGARFHSSNISNADGHDYVHHAAANGASAALICRDLPDQTKADFHLPLIRTEDTYDALWQLGRAGRARLSEPVIAITGSSGKTTAKRFMSAALGAYTSPGSFNNHIGVPLTLANAPKPLDAGHSGLEPGWIFEIGTSHPGEIRPLTTMVDPHLAILLNVHSAHMENFPNRQALIDEKSQIFTTLPTTGLRVVDEQLGISGYTFGTGQAAAARICELNGDRLRVEIFGNKLSAKVPGGGQHRALTLSAVLLAMTLLERDLAAGCELDDDVIPEGRGNALTIADITVVDDSYNANPTSMLAAIKSFADYQMDTNADKTAQQGKNYVLLGEMRELGALSANAHREVLENLTAIDGAFLVGQAMIEAAAGLSVSGGKHPNSVWQSFAQADEALVAAIVRQLKPGDRLLIKGSNRVFWAIGFRDKLFSALSQNR